jgi:hypothetical protein
MLNYEHRPAVPQWGWLCSAGTFTNVCQHFGLSQFVGEAGIGPEQVQQEQVPHLSAAARAE